MSTPNTLAPRSQHGWLAAAACLLLASLLACPARAGETRKLLQPALDTFTGTAIVIDQDFPGKKPSSRCLALRTPDDEKVEVHVDDPEELAGLHTGMEIEATGEWLAKTPGSSRRFKATGLKCKGKCHGKSENAGPKKLARAAAAPGGGSVTAAATLASGAVRAAAITLSTNQLITADVSAIIIPIVFVDASGQSCPGTGAQPVTTAGIKSTVFGADNPTGHSVAETYNTCSYNKSMMTTTNSRVATTVKLPCSNATNGITWNSSKCDYDDWNGVAEAADAALNSRGVLLSKYNYRVYLLPPGFCDIVGFAYVGCDPARECRSWIGGEYWNQPQAIIHELGHNLFLGHASVTLETGVVDDYGDSGCTMGYCCDDRCFNTPHAWQMGWISVQQLDGNSLRAGQTVTATLPSQGLAARSGLRIKPTWAVGEAPIFVGYRTRAGADDALFDDIAGKVHVHTAAIIDTYSAVLTSWKTSLSVLGKSWTHPTTGVVVRLKSFPAYNGIAKGAAIVTICRSGGAETAASCAAGTDNDCNGLAGAKDPACALVQ